MANSIRVNKPKPWAGDSLRVERTLGEIVLVATHSVIAQKRYRMSRDDAEDLAEELLRAAGRG